MQPLIYCFVDQFQQLPLYQQNKLDKIFIANWLIYYILIVNIAHQHPLKVN